MSDGAIALFPASAPAEHSFSWSTGSSDSRIDQLAEGVYQVTVTDPYGCTDNYEFMVGVGVDTEDRLEETFARVFPNPSADGWFELRIASAKTIDRLDLRLYDATQRLIQADAYRNIRELGAPLNLSGYAPGIYFVQLVADGSAQTLKLVKL